MTSPDFSRLTVARVDKATAKRICVENHYSKKWNNGLFGAENYGVYLDDELLGVAVYGYSMNPASWARVTATAPEKCLELNRLWIDDRLGANTETWLLGRTFRLLKADGYELIQSFADGRLGVGTIYQAANFTYHGHHDSTFHRDTATGEVFHAAPFSNTATARPMLERNALFPAGRLETFKVRTYRYLYPLTRHARRSIHLPAKDYPKERTGELVVPDYRPPASQIARSALIAEALGDPREAELREYLATLTPTPEEALEAQRANRWIRALRGEQ